MPDDNKLREKIFKLKRERDAVFLVHNYQRDEVQDIADFVGDSLGLSQQAAKTNAEVIVFCGVHFMAETAAILCPDKKVLLPDMTAGCPMADMITAPKLRQKKQEHPRAKVVCYVNSTADVKAESDICCTSSNAVKVVEATEADEILFVPDKYLGHYVSTQTNKKIIGWEGYCPTHVKILPEDIEKARREHPAAKVIVHPECRPEVIALADEVGSTGKICSYPREVNADEFIIGTEVGILHRLRKENPTKKFYPASELAVCPNMKKITLEKVLWALEDMDCQVEVSKEVAQKALGAIEKMLKIV